MKLACFEIGVSELDILRVWRKKSLVDILCDELGDSDFDALRHLELGPTFLLLGKIIRLLVYKQAIKRLIKILNSDMVYLM